MKLILIPSLVLLGLVSLSRSVPVELGRLKREGTMVENLDSRGSVANVKIATLSHPAVEVEVAPAEDISRLDLQLGKPAVLGVEVARSEDVTVVEASDSVRPDEIVIVKEKEGEHHKREEHGHSLLRTRDEEKRVEEKEQDRREEHGAERKEEDRRREDEEKRVVIEKKEHPVRSAAGEAQRKESSHEEVTAMEDNKARRGSHEELDIMTFKEMESRSGRSHEEISIFMTAQEKAREARGEDVMRAMIEQAEGMSEGRVQQLDVIGDAIDASSSFDQFSAAVQPEDFATTMVEVANAPITTFSESIAAAPVQFQSASDMASVVDLLSNPVAMETFKEVAMEPAAAFPSSSVDVAASSFEGFLSASNPLASSASGAQVASSSASEFVKFPGAMSHGFNIFKTGTFSRPARGAMDLQALQEKLKEGLGGGREISCKVHERVESRNFADLGKFMDDMSNFAIFGILNSDAETPAEAVAADTQRDEEDREALNGAQVDNLDVARLLGNSERTAVAATMMEVLERTKRDLLDATAGEVFESPAEIAASETESVLERPEIAVEESETVLEQPAIQIEESDTVLESAATAVEVEGEAVVAEAEPAAEVSAVVLEEETMLEKPSNSAAAEIAAAGVNLIKGAAKRFAATHQTVRSHPAFVRAQKEFVTGVKGFSEHIEHILAINPTDSEKGVFEAFTELESAMAKADEELALVEALNAPGLKFSPKFFSEILLKIARVFTGSLSHLAVAAEV